MTDAFYVPDEALPHERTFMQWPVNRTVHRDRFFLDMLQDAIADVANAIAEFEPVVMLADQQFQAAAKRKLSGQVDLWDIPTDDLWARDSSPLFAVDGKGGLAVRQLNFNGWGNKQVHGNDGLIAERVAQRMGLPILDNGLVGEPGGVEADGHGTLIAHESSWINPNRNAQSEGEITDLLLEAYGAEKIIWAPGIKDADITDYHIDALARFVEPGKVIIQLPDEPDPDEPWHRSALETYDILQAATDAQGNQLELVVIADALEPRVRSDDFVAAYVNYYVCNGAVISAAFGDAEADALAFDTLSELYPDREIIALNVDPIGEVGGGIHCATREQPRV